MNSELQRMGYGLCLLVGSAVTDAKQRTKFQKYLETGHADEVLAFIGDTRESFITGISDRVKLLVNR